MPNTSKAIHQVFPLILGLMLFGTYCKSNSYNFIYQDVQQNDPFSFQVVDSTTLAPIDGVLVEYVSGDWKLTQKNGNIRISRYRINQQIRLSKWGYITKTLMLDSSKLVSSKIYLMKVARIEESEVKAITINTTSLIENPSSIEKISSKDIQNATTFNYYELVGKQRGMSLYHSGILASSPSALGFGRIGNPRILQIDDGVNYQLPDFNFSIGNLNGTPELDIESIEVMPMGVSSLYGPGASNGLVKINSKDPFNFPGLSAQAKIGANRVQTISGTKLTPIYKFDLRYAKSVTLNKNFIKRLGIKAVFSFVETSDWQPQGPGNINLTGNQDQSRNSDPGYDGANVFGDEYRYILPFGSSGSDEIVTRTGYHESYLLDYTAKSILLNLGLYWKITKNIMASFEIEPSEATTVFSGSSRLELPNMSTDKVKFSVQSNVVNLTYYELSRDVGNSFDTKLLGRNLNLIAKGSTSWLQDYTAAYGGGIANVSSQDHEAARGYANGVGLNIFGSSSPWLSPSDPNFNGIVDQLINNQVQGFINFPVQSEFQGSSRIENLDLQFDFSSFIKFVNLKVGYLKRISNFDNINQSIISIDPILFQSDLEIEETGGFIQASKKLFNDKLFITGVIRRDNRSNFKTQHSSMAAISYNLNHKFYFRASYGEGFRNPSFIEEYIFKDVGPTVGLSIKSTLRGGFKGGFADLEFALDNNNFPRIPIIGNTIFMKNIIAFEEAVNKSVENGIPSNQAKIDHLDILGAGILQAGDLQLLIAEQSRTYEMGVRAKLTSDLYIDASYIQNQMDNLIGQTGLARPLSVIPPIQDTLGIVDLIRDDRTRQVIYYYQNARSTIKAHNILLGMDYYLANGFTIRGNGRYSTVKFNKDDIVNAAFNSPKYSVNLSIENKGFTPNAGFGIDFHWQDSFQWNSQLAHGKVPSYFNVDAQINYFLERFDAKLKLGASNLFQQKYIDNVGGPTIGSVYYISILLEDIMN